MFQEGTSAVTFNSAFYLQSNPDVFQAIQNGTFQGSALQHFMQFGQFEGRDPNAFFDTEYYLAENTDVLVAIANPAVPSVTSAFQHFVMFGSDEGVVRAPSAAFESFNPDTYLAANPDLQAAFGNLTGEAQDRALFAHFLEFGVNENRPGTGVDVDAGLPGSNFVLTTAVDNLTGTTGNDTFSGIIGGANPTFTAGDTIDGGAGTDRLNLTAIAGGVTTVATDLNNVEQVFVRPTGNFVTTLDASDWSGVDQVWADRTAGTVVTNELDGSVTLGLNNTAATARNVANFEAGLGTNATLSVAVNNALGGFRANTQGTDLFTALSVNAAAGASEFFVASDTPGDFALKSITVEGQGSLNLIQVADRASFANVTTVDASANTGGLEINLANNVKDITITGGSGDDRFVLGGSLSAKDTVNGGAGFDTVVVNGGNFSAPALAAPFNGLTSIERVEFVGAGTTLQGTTFTNASITNLLFNTSTTSTGQTDGADVILNAGSARTYEFGNENAGSATFELKSTATTLNIDLLGNEGANTGTGADVAGITVNYGAGTAATAVTTLNLTSEGDLTTGQTNSTGGISIRQGSTIVIDGDADLVVGNFTVTSGTTVDPTQGLTIDASSFTGDLVIGGSANGDVFTLGDGDARINLLGGQSGETVGTEPGQTENLVNFDVINGFTAGTDGDVLAVTGPVAATFFASEGNLDAIASTLLEAAEFAIIGGGTGDTAFAGGGTGWTAFEFGGETYAVYNADGTDFTDANDVIVNLAGVDLDDLVGTNFAVNPIAP